MTVRPTRFDRECAPRGVSVPSDERVVVFQTRVLVAAAADDVRTLALSGADSMQLKERLADLELRTAGCKSRACRILAEQIDLWFDTHDADRANALSHSAITEHVAAAMFRNSGRRINFENGHMPALGARPLPEGRILKDTSNN